MDETIIKLSNQIKDMVCIKVEANEGINDSQLEEEITQIVFEKSKEYFFTPEERLELVKTTYNKMRGLDLLEPLLKDDSISEIMINGIDNIFIERNGRIIKLKKSFESVSRLEDVVQRIVSNVNRKVNEADPICEARLKDGSRVSVVLPPIALNGPIVTIRKFTKEPMSIKRLIQYG